MPEILEFGNAFLIKTIEIAAVPTGGTLERVDLQQKKKSAWFAILGSESMLARKTRIPGKEVVISVSNSGALVTDMYGEGLGL